MFTIARNMHRIFVYGTLKTGEPNFHLMTDSALGKAVFVGKARTVRKFPMLIASRYNIPYLLYKPGTGHRIHGEVYDVDDQLLEFLDKFENHPNYYVRQYEDVEFEDGNQPGRAWTYILMTFKEDLLQKPFMANYSSKGEHGLEYVERYLRDAEDPNNTHYREVKKDSVRIVDYCTDRMLHDIAYIFWRLAFHLL